MEMQGTKLLRLWLFPCMLKWWSGEDNHELKSSMNEAGEKERRCYEPKISKNLLLENRE